MERDNVLELKNPETFADNPIADILHGGARQSLAEELEAQRFLAMHTDLKGNKGHQRITSNGYISGREIQTGIGRVPENM